jgi:hypothetical protein
MRREFHATEARVALEIAWRDRLDRDPSLAKFVIAEGTAQLPYHRWIPYRQGFAPALIARFFDGLGKQWQPVLDPFGGSGTTLIESARLNRFCVATDAMPALVAAMSGIVAPADDEAPPAVTTWADAHTSRGALTRAAIASAIYRSKPLRERTGPNARPDDNTPPAALVAQAWERIAQDRARFPLTRGGAAVCADARRLPLADESIGAILTSPPYLARYDYAALGDPDAFAAAGFTLGGERGTLIPAFERAPHKSGRGMRTRHPAAVEAAQRLHDAGETRWAAVVTAHFDALERVLRECARVARPGARCWWVVGAARLADEYVPSDLIVAELAQAAGFEVDRVVEARRLVPGGLGGGKRLGPLRDIAPRESVIEMRR